MEFFIELVAEALVASAKESPEEMPEIEYKEHFVVRHPRKKNTCAYLWLIDLDCRVCSTLDSD